LDEEAAAIEAALRRRWDTPGSALLGAGLGALVQGSHELQQNVTAQSGVSEPVTHSLLALAMATLAGTLLLTAVAVVHNVTTRRLSRKIPAPGLVYHWNDFTFAGATLGILLVLAHEAFNFLSGRWQTDFLGSTDPFTHIVWELIIVALGGELWFRAVVKIRNWDAS
jgi:divalent metal cation (Fe/Co/Zn/Cd) transporter